MKIVYLGPSDKVNVYPYGAHKQGAVKEYPEQFGAELLATNKKQRFEAVREKEEKILHAKAQSIKDGLDAPDPSETTLDATPADQKKKTGKKGK